LLISYWQTGANPTYHSGWSQPRDEPGFGLGNACFGRTGCRQAWLYILKHPGDIEGAKEIAAMYCVTNFDQCAWEATKEEVANQAMFDVLTSLYGVAGGIYRAGAGTAKAAEAVAIRTKGSLCSFPDDTPILMADGTYKPIDDVRTGDMVLAANPETGESGPRAVLTPLSTEGTKTFIQVTVDTDGSVGNVTGEVIATSEHPFWVPNLRTWIPAGELRVGDFLHGSTGVKMQVLKTRKWTTVQRVRNLMINGINTYYVAAGNAAVLVHNDKCGVDLDALKLNAIAPVNPRQVRGDTVASRAYQKHTWHEERRPSSTLPEIRSGVERRDVAHYLIDDLLTSPKSAVQAWDHPQHGPVYDFWLPDVGARWTQSGRFIGFLDP
jgi:hypothetical protein